MSTTLCHIVLPLLYASPILLAPSCPVSVLNYVPALRSNVSGIRFIDHTNLLFPLPDTVTCRQTPSAYLQVTVDKCLADAISQLLLGNSASDLSFHESDLLFLLLIVRRFSTTLFSILDIKIHCLLFPGQMSPTSWCG